MTRDITAVAFVCYVVLWVALAIGSWWMIRRQPTPQDKKRWSDRVALTAGVFVTGFICFFIILWKQYVVLPVFIAVGVLITFLNVRNTFYCDNCGKRSLSQKWFSSGPVHCPYCGHQLR
jgi:DNA-directed RNA polymerase subunit RPC12/RpoP